MENNNMPVRCPKCTNIVTGRFCSFCGTDLTAEQYKQQQQQYAQYTQNPQYAQYAQYTQNPQYAQNPQYQAPAMPVKKKKNGVMVAIVVFLCIVVFLSFATLILSTVNRVTKFVTNENQAIPFTENTTPQYHFTAGVSIDEFNKLENGMTYAHISSIIGGDGQLMNDGTNLKDEKFLTYAWPGENNETAIVFITITNDAVSEIVLEGTLD